MVRFSAAGAFLFLLVLVPTSASAQTTATISGTIADDTGAVLPGVTITVTNVETGAVRTAVVDQEGRYRIVNLAPGDYEVQAELVGFQTAVRRGIVLTLGREAVVELKLRIGDIAERIIVTGEAPLVETSSGSLGQVVDSKTISELPILGRDLMQLVTLQTGATAYRVAGRETGNGLRLTVGGMRPDTNVLMLDGVSLETSAGYTPTGSSESFLGMEAIREFKVETNSYSAEFGRSSGGVFNAITKSGTNELHGSVFEFHRGDALQNRNFFDEEKPDFKRDQFGFSLGGRLVRNKTFFFGTYEGLRENLGSTTISQTFTEPARRGILGDRTLPIQARVQPYLALWPLPNGPILDHGNGTGDFSFTSSRPTDEDFYQARLDYQFSGSDTIFARYTHLDSNRVLPESFPQFRTLEDVRNRYATVEYKKIFSQSVLSTSRFGFSSTDPTEFSEQDPVDPRLYFVPSVPQLGSVSVTGVSGIGQGTTGGNQKVDSYQFTNDVAYTRGRQFLKVGLQWNHIKYDGWNPARDAGDYTFGSIPDFFNANPSRFRGSIAEGFNDAFRELSQNIVGLYVQDDIQLTPRFTVNAGLRYEFITVPHEEQGRVGNFRGDIDFIQRASFADITLGNPWFKNPSLKNVAPRLGFAWNVAGDGKTAVRGGFGIFHLQFNQSWIETTVFRMPPFLIEMQATRNVPFPDIFSQCGGDDPLNPQNPLCSARPAPDFVPYEFETPYVAQYNLNVQREIFPQTVLTVGYVGSRGHGLPGVADVNISPATVVNDRLVFTATSRPNPNFDDIRRRYPAASSSYNALQVSLNRRFHNGLQFRTSYAFGKSIDDTSGISTASAVSGGPNWITYFYDPSLHRGPSAFDIRHNFSFSYAYELPVGPGRRFGSGLSGAAGTILAGWQLGGIVSLVSGFPGTVEIASRLTGIGLRQEFPDLVPGADNNPNRSQDPEHYLDPASFAFPPTATLGNLGRNTFTMPGLATVDFSLAKNTRIGTRLDTQFRVEIFNLLDRANFGVPDRIVFDRQGRPSATFGRITNTATTARQIQLGLKLLF